MIKINHKTDKMKKARTEKSTDDFWTMTVLIFSEII